MEIARGIAVEGARAVAKETALALAGSEFSPARGVEPRRLVAADDRRQAKPMRVFRHDLPRGPERDE